MAGWPYIMVSNHRHFSWKSSDIKCDHRQFVTVDSWDLKVTEDSELTGKPVPLKWEHHLRISSILPFCFFEFYKICEIDSK